MAASSWLERLPGPDLAVNEFPDCPDVDALEIHDVRVTSAGAAGADVFEKPELVNVVLDGCDVAGFVGRSGRADRILVRDGRLRGVSWIAGTVQDAVLERVTGSELSLRFSTLRRVLFRECAIDELDLTEAVFEDVRFERCVFRGARFHRANVTRLRIEGCDLTGCSGAEALRGASVHPDDILSLGPSLAEAVGLTLEEADP